MFSVQGSTNILQKSDRLPHPIDEDRLDKFDDLQSDLKTDRNEVVVEDDECQKIVTEVADIRP